MQTSAFRMPRWVVVFVLIWSGCLPHSCQRTESRILFPSDSLSRALAESIEADTLEQLWSLEDQSLAYPRSIQWEEGGESLLVADSKSGEIVRVSADGELLDRFNIPETPHPYLAGSRGDTLFVLDPDGHQIHLVKDDAVARSFAVDAQDVLDRAFVYATAVSDGVVIKAVRKDLGASLVFLDDAGSVRDVRALEGPYWRHAGFLRTWGDSVVSLCGYRPVLDVIQGPNRVDSLALKGFDSPMLGRSRMFVLGNVDEPPLLSSSAVPLGDYLFVLNMRPGWLRVDVFDRDGTLQQILTERHDVDYGFYPVDLAVRKTTGGDYQIAIAVAGNTPRVGLYQWAAGKG